MYKVHITAWRTVAGSPDVGFKDSIKVLPKWPRCIVTTPVMILSGMDREGKGKGGKGEGGRGGTMRGG